MADVPPPITPSPLWEAAEAALRQHFGHATFRGTQADVVRDVLDGHDTLVLMPTGAGKSLCYQLPALVCPGTAVVISPLIALMKNQVDALHLRGIAAAHLNSSLTRAETERVREQIRAGELRLLYLSPETFGRDDVLDMLAQLPISLVAIDEAHCISEWGHDFRPEYRRLRELINRLPNRGPILALTATATPRVRQDILNALRAPEARVHLSGFDRPNLHYMVQPKAAADLGLVRFIHRHQGQSGIVYCFSRKMVETWVDRLQANGIRALPYHAGLDATTRAHNQEAFLNHDVEVVVATIAFGMGIDKPDIRFVVHYDAPRSLEHYYQETGRAGRDGEPAECVLFYDHADLVKLQKLMRDKTPAEREVARQQMEEMAWYAETPLCRRRWLLHYFGEAHGTQGCGQSCDNCRFVDHQKDVTETARHALAGLAQHVDAPTRQEAVALCQQALEEAGLTGQLHQSTEAGRWLVQQMLLEGWLTRHPQAPTRVMPAQPGNHLTLPLALDEAPKPEGPTNGVAQLYDALIKVRDAEAERLDLPPYVVMLEATLRDLAVKRPRTADELTNLVGMTPQKARRFGQPFLACIAEHLSANDAPPSPEELMRVRTATKTTSEKLFIIAQIDRRQSLEAIAEARDLALEELLIRLEGIVMGGAKLRLGPYLDEWLDDRVDELMDYFAEYPDETPDRALEELQPDFSPEEIRLGRLAYYVEHAL